MAQKKKFYAVRVGRESGVFNTWAECKSRIDGYSGAIYKSFPTKDEATAYVKMEGLRIQPEENTAIAYVDGSYLHSAKRFSFGAILFHDGEEKQFSEAFSDKELAKMRNVAGEIKGAEFIMRYCVCNKIPAVRIYYDYEGIEKWCSGDWKTNKDGTKAYRNSYLECAEKVNISFCKVKGHSGDTYNDLVDKLAKSALGINE